DAAGVGRATLYRHFSSREDLIRALAVESIREMDRATAHIEESATSARHAIELVFEAVAPLGERYHFLTMETSLFDDPGVTRSWDRQRRDMSELIELAKEEGSMARDVPTPWAVAAADALIYAAWTAVKDGDVARNDAGRLASRTFLDGLGPTSRGDAGLS
ncbi:MAG: TetR/AcrR family transcriptional regulator, partial [Gemmatimonadetes bacterium]|nr:TetR/AcrR family transcriptional regulator [Gemmatimonadota bacterium]